MKTIKIVLLVLVNSCSLDLMGQNFTSVSDGSWTNNAVWGGGGNPGIPINLAAGNITINHTVVVTNDINFQDTRSYTVNGRLYVLGDLTMDGSANLTISAGDTLIVQGNLTIKGTFNMNNLGIFVVTGNSIIDESAVVTTSSDFYVYGTRYMSGNATYNGTHFWDFPDSEATGWNSTALPGVVQVCADNVALCDFANDVELPVGLISFQVHPNEDGNHLTWNTAQEYCFDKFIVEKSNDGLHYISIGEMPGAGFSRSILSYEFSDPEIDAPINYYRLLMLDLDSTTSYSSTIMATNNNSQANLQIYPNPARRGKSIYFSSATENQTIGLYPINGEQPVLNVKIDGLVSQIQIPENILKGVYVLTITSTGFRKQWLVKII